MTLYFKRFWHETTGDLQTNDWGTSTYYFETDQSGEVTRQLEVYTNGRRLKYTLEHLEDDYGGLSDVALDLEEFKEFAIPKTEFEQEWQH